MSEDVKMFNIGDYVYIRFSDRSIKKGQIVDILNTESFNYVVRTTVYDKECNIYCNEKDLTKYD